MKRFAIVLAVLAAFCAALPAAPPAHAQQSGNQKIRKDCEVKADKQKLKGLTREGYIEQCVNALSFNTQYGTK